MLSPTTTSRKLLFISSTASCLTEKWDLGRHEMGGHKHAILISLVSAIANNSDTN